MELVPSAFPAEATSPHPDEQRLKPYLSKRGHRKSRGGCADCKLRKVKCDEARPKCRYCRLRKVPCEYTDVPSPPKVVSQPAILLPSTDMVDMKLLWFYTIKTSESFSIGQVRRDAADTMRTSLVQQAFGTPFLMQALLALSASHMQNLDQPIGDETRALRHRSRAFESFRQAVERADPSTFSALLATSLLMTAISSQNFRDPDMKKLFMVDWLLVWRGIKSVFALTVDAPDAISGSIRPLFYRPSSSIDDNAVAVPTELRAMLQHIDPQEKDYADISTYDEILWYLGLLFSHLYAEGLTPVTTLRIGTWFTIIPNSFVELARQKRPRALVILAHYCVFLKMVQDVWWLAGVGERAITDLLDSLGGDLIEYSTLPVVASQCSDASELVDLVLTHYGRGRTGFVKAYAHGSP